MTTDFWSDKYPPGIPRQIDPDQYRNVLAVLCHCCDRYGSKPAFTSLGSSLSYRELYERSGQFGAWLQHHTDLQPGDRIAIQLPNILQYPVALFGAMRAGLVVVNTNPLYTARELEHQLVDSGAAAILCLANMAHRVEEVLPRTAIRHVLVTELGDLLPTPRRQLVNAVVRYVKRLVPPYRLPGATPLRDALALGARRILREANPDPDDTAVLQYTGGTTGVAKGAMLSHRNLVANMLQCHPLMTYRLDEGCELMVAPLPLYHIYAFTLHCGVMLLIGANNLLIANPRDLDGFVKELRRQPFSGLVGLNTLFAGLCNHEGFRRLDFSALKATFSGGMALQQAIYQQWEAVTGCPIAEGYGLTETSPVVSVNPFQKNRPGTIGLPLPSTYCKVIDDSGAELPPGAAGELCIKGPQVMKGYWQRPEATAEVLDADGWLKTGDIAVIEADGFMRIVDRKKDMILVSGFNVYPNELEDVLAALPGVQQCAAIGVPDPVTGEQIKMFVVAKPGVALTHEQVMRHLHDNLTGYKRPKLIEFRDSLPTSNVGKILRRELRQQVLQESEAAPN